ncbi:hypothetical protein Pelo_9106 [Pelomyxa schiedti]|nr:hypothetical protein Pelo_9106 [Pelomyxa schiedti]
MSCYPLAKRRRVLSHQNESVGVVARIEGVSESMVRRYRQQVATLKELQTVVLAATHEFCKLWQISRAIKKLGFHLRFTTRKIIGERNEAQRRAWFTNTLTETPHGIFCVPVEVLLDLDEMGCTLLDTARRKGHSLPGQPGRTHHPPQSKHLTLIMGADVNVGSLGCFVFPGTLNTSLFYVWLAVVLLPQIRGQKRILLMDNHKAHLHPSIFALVAQEGHLLVPRPVASPDLAWIELCFAEVKRCLRESPGQITEQNLAQHIYKAAFAIDGPLVQKFASACHYYVPGLPYTPYTNPD